DHAVAEARRAHEVRVDLVRGDAAPVASVAGDATLDRPEEVGRPPRGGRRSEHAVVASPRGRAPQRLRRMTRERDQERLVLLEVGGDLSVREVSVVWMR